MKLDSACKSSFFEQSNNIFCFVSAVAIAAAFCLFVAWPYYFQGYNELSDALPAKGLGWTRYTLFGTVSYVLTGKGFGLGLLYLGIVFTMYIGPGGPRNLGIARLVVKLALAFVFTFFISEFHLYHGTLNGVLD